MKKQSIDLATLDTTAACNKGAEIELKHPVTNAPLGVFITVLGRDSDTFKDYIRHSINDQIRKEAIAKKRGRDMEVQTLEMREADTIELLTVCTVGWKNVVMGGNELPFNVANAKRVYSDRPWIRQQVNEAIGDLENFMTC